MNLKIKKLHSDAVIPQQMTEGSAGLDLTAISKEWDAERGVLVFGTGLAMQIPRGHVGLLFPRSSIFKTGLSLANAVGVIDSDYTGEVKAIFYPGNRPRNNYEVGDRVVQLVIMPIPAVNIQVVDELNDTKRSSGGFGSTGA
jgi:dUTP pyrophosphatase